MLILLFLLLSLLTPYTTQGTFLNKPILLENQNQEELKSYTVLSTNRGKKLYVGGNGQVSATPQKLLKSDLDYILKTNKNKYKGYNNPNMNKCKTIDKEFKKLLLAFPQNIIWEWKLENVIGNDVLCFKEGETILIPGLPRNFIADIAFKKDLKYIVYNHKDIINFINNIKEKSNYNKKKTKKENQLAIWNYLTKTIEYDKATIDMDKIKKGDIGYKSTPGFYLQSFFENKSSVCGALSNGYGLIVNYLELGESKITKEIGKTYFENKNIRHAFLVEKRKNEKRIYDLTWNLGREKNDFFDLTIPEAKVYLSSEGLNFKTYNSFKFSKAKKLYNSGKHRLFFHYFNNTILKKLEINYWYSVLLGVILGLSIGVFLDFKDRLKNKGEPNKKNK